MEESQVGVHEGQHLHIKNEQKTVIVQTDVKKKNPNKYYSIGFIVIRR